MLQQHREKWVLQAFIVLQHHEPAFFQHAARVFQGWEYDPAKCPPGATACTGGAQWRVLTFKEDPLSMSLLDLAALIGHEALHYGVRADGSLVQVHHACRDPLCSLPQDRNADSIYREHRALHARLATKVAPRFHPLVGNVTKPAQTGWSADKIVVGVVAIAAVFGAVWLGPKVIGAMVAA